MSLDSRTRQSNAAEAGNRFLPKVYKIYPEDVAALSLNIERAMKRKRDAPFEFFFCMLQAAVPLHTSQHGRAQLELCSFEAELNLICHLPLCYYTGAQRPLFWLMDKTAGFLRSRKKVAKYPFMGLGEVGNVTSTCPEVESSHG